MNNEATALVENIQRQIYAIRGLHVMLDADLAELYGVQTKVLNQAVKRNSDRFPPEFMFQLSEAELEILRSQNVTSSFNYLFSLYLHFLILIFYQLYLYILLL